MLGKNVRSPDSLLLGSVRVVVIMVMAVFWQGLFPPALARLGVEVVLDAAGPRHLHNPMGRKILCKAMSKANQ